MPLKISLVIFSLFNIPSSKYSEKSPKLINFISKSATILLLPLLVRSVIFFFFPDKSHNINDPIV